MARKKDGRTVRVRAADTPLRIVGAALSGALFLGVAGIVALLVVVPALGDGAALTVLTGSMQPTLKPGDVVVVRGVDTADVCEKVSIGDIVTFLPEPDDPSLITHRVVGKTVGTFDDGTTCRLITQGDDNNAADVPISPAQVRGVFWYGLPRLGWAKQWIMQHQTLLVVAAGAVVLVWWAMPRRRATRVITVPAAAVPESHTQRERELDLREREVAVREAELARVLTAPGDVPTGPTSQVPHPPPPHDITIGEDPTAPGRPVEGQPVDGGPSQGDAPPDDPARSG